VNPRIGQATARLRVDFIACDGRGLCAEALPGLITLDDWGFPIMTGEAVPPGRLADARETVRACPMLALRLEYGVTQLAPHAGADRHDFSSRRARVGHAATVRRASTSSAGGTGSGSMIG
jgi:ferredoxin